MTRMPAFCISCGAIFRSTFVADNAYHTAFSYCTAGPCPNCGGIGRIPDGVYNFIGNTIELLSGSGRTVEELNRLDTILRLSKEKGSTPEQVKEEVQREVPELANLFDTPPKTRSVIYSVITIILTIIQLLLPASNQQ